MPGRSQEAFKARKTDITGVVSKKQRGLFYTIFLTCAYDRKLPRQEFYTDTYTKTMLEGLKELKNSSPHKGTI